MQNLTIKVFERIDPPDSWGRYVAELRVGGDFREAHYGNTIASTLRKLAAGVEVQALDYKV